MKQTLNARLKQLQAGHFFVTLFFWHFCLDYTLSVANRSKFFSFSIVRAAAMDMKVRSVCQNIYLGLNFTGVKPR